MRIVIDIGNGNSNCADNHLIYICHRCGRHLEFTGVSRRILWHPHNDKDNCEDAGSYCNRPLLIFTETSRDNP